MRIYLIDDARVLRSLFERIVTALGHTIVASDSAPVALERLCALAPDAVVVDGRLRATDVAVFLQELRARLPAARLLLVASLEEPALVATARAAGAGIVRRPFSRVQICDALRSS